MCGCINSRNKSKTLKNRARCRARNPVYEIIMFKKGSRMKMTMTRVTALFTSSATQASLEPRVSMALCQRLVAWRDSAIMKFLWIFFEFFDWLFAEQQPIKKLKNYSSKFHYPRVSPGDQPLTKSRKNSGLEIGHKPSYNPVPRVSRSFWSPPNFALGLPWSKTRGL